MPDCPLPTPPEAEPLKVSDEPLLTIADAARFFSVHPRTVANWMRSGTFPTPCAMLPGRSPRWTAAALVAFANGTIDRNASAVQASSQASV